VTQAIETIKPAQQDRFSQTTEHIKQLLSQRAQPDQVIAVITDFTRTNDNPAQNLLLQGLTHFLTGDSLSAVRILTQANDLLSENEYPTPSSICSIAFVQAQLALPRRQRPVTKLGYQFFKENLTALRQIDPVLARQLQNSSWPDEIVLVQYWGGLHLYSHSHSGLLLLENDFKHRVAGNITQRPPFGFSGIATGQEIGYCLDHQYQGPHGMTRAHYLFEKNPEQIKALLHLRNFSCALLSNELMIFAGTGLKQRLKDVFGTLRYVPPAVLVNADDHMSEHTESINEQMNVHSSTDAAKQYYHSSEFRQRQQRIAAGATQPRIWIITARWTTFLKYCAADFQKAFERLGCSTQFFIEEDDVQVPMLAYHWRLLEQFKPDAVFLISHGRPAFRHLPQELPVISFLQDRCSQLWTLPDADLNNRISPQDLFICLVEEFQQHLLSRRIHKQQSFIMPVPADEEMFYPLPADHQLCAKFSSDISYVKHGNADTDAIMTHWLGSVDLAEIDNPAKRVFADFYTGLYHLFLQDLGRLWPEHELHELLDQRFSQDVAPQYHHQLHQLMTSFAIEVYTACRRRYYLQGLAEHDLPLRLFGNDWRADKLFSRYAAGAVRRDTELNAVYNFSKINLHLQPYITMHQRLSECGLAGGFMMVAEIPPEQDWSPARNYFEADKEIVFFDTKEDLVDRCRHYLDHEDERHRIAQNMRRRALGERTCIAAAQTILEKWRQLLQTVPLSGSVS